MNTYKITLATAIKQIWNLQMLVVWHNSLKNYTFNTFLKISWSNFGSYICIKQTNRNSSFLKYVNNGYYSSLITSSL